MIDALAAIGVIGTILTAVIGAGLARKWVWGYQLAEMTKDRDMWRDLALQSFAVNAKAVEITAKASGV